MIITATPDSPAGRNRLHIRATRPCVGINRKDGNGSALVRTRTGVLPYTPTLTETGRNRFKNPQFENDVSGLVLGNLTVVRTTDAAAVAVGSGAARLAVTASPTVYTYVYMEIAGVLPGDWVGFSTMVRWESGSVYVRLRVSYLDAAGTYLGTYQSAVVPLTGEQIRRSNTAAAPAPAGTTRAFAMLYFYGDQAATLAPAAGSTYTTDAWLGCKAATQAAAAAAVAEPYWDGYTTAQGAIGYEFTGAASNSESRRLEDLTGFFVDDYEAAHGTNNYLALDQPGVDVSGFAVPAASAELILQGPWIGVPVQPQFSIQVPAVYGLDGIRASRSSELEPLGRADVIVLLRPLGPRRGTIKIVTGTTYADAAALESACNQGEILMLRQPEHTGMDMYFHAAGASITNITIAGGATLWGLDLQYVAVPRPEGDQNGALGWDFADVAAAHYDFAAVDAAYVDFDALAVRKTA